MGLLGKTVKGLADVVDGRTFFHNTDAEVSGLLEARPSRTGSGIFGLEKAGANYGANSIPFKVRGKVAGPEVDDNLNSIVKEVTGSNVSDYSSEGLYEHLLGFVPEQEVQAIFKQAGYGARARKSKGVDVIQAFGSDDVIQMDTPSRMARAKEQGYNVDDVTYRWLSEDYPDNKLPTNSRYKFGDAIYSSPEPSYGQAYANELSSNPVAYPMIARGKIANKDDAIRAEKTLIEEGRKPKDYTQSMNAINQQLKTEGFTGLDYAGERMMFGEDTSRSIFAAFDPAKTGSSNILASNPAASTGAGILGLAAMAGSDDADAGVLSKAKGLLMDTPSRMARAKEQGFDVDTPVYHGTSEDFDSFDPDRAIGTQFWSTTNKAEIESGDVGAQGSGVIKEMYHKIKNPAGWEEYDKFGIDELISRGYDGLKLPDGNGNYTYTAFDPSQYRSVDAAFDPAKTGSSNLLASNPVATAGAGILGLGAAAQSNDTYADYSPANIARLQSDDVGSIEAPQSMAAANIAGLMGSVNKVGYDDPLLGMVASQLPSELMNKIAYNDKRGLLDYAKAYAGLLGF